MREKPETIYRCGDCGKEWGQNDKICSNCGSTRKCSPVFAEGTIKLRTGLRGKIQNQNQLGKAAREFKSVSKLSNYGKEAREYYDVDREHNRYVHNVEEQDENGNWVQKHHEDETLTEHNKKKQSKK